MSRCTLQRPSNLQKTNPTTMTANTTTQTVVTNALNSLFSIAVRSPNKVVKFGTLVDVELLVKHRHQIANPSDGNP